MTKEYLKSLSEEEFTKVVLDTRNAEHEDFHLVNAVLADELIVLTSQYLFDGYTFEQALSIGIMGQIRAIYSFDYNNGETIRQSIARFVQEEFNRFNKYLETK